MMMNYTMIALWGVVNVLQMYKMVRSIIVYEINRRRDKKLYAKNIYITRSDRSEIIVLAVALPMTPALMFMVHLLGDIGFHFLYDVGAFLFTCFLLYVFNETAGSYTKISPEGIERGEPCNDTVFFPLNAIDSVSYDNNTDREYADSLHFYTKSGKLVAEFCPVFGSYPLLAMTRFRIENDRWPDIGNPEDTAQINAWANRRSTLRYFSYGKISGLAEVDM